MGSNDFESERPVRSVDVSAFWLMKNEVTIASTAFAWMPVCTAPGDNYSAEVSDADELPVRNITWAQAKTYAAFAGGQLPTEAEWEYAATNQGQSVLYPWRSTYQHVPTTWQTLAIA